MVFCTRFFLCSAFETWHTKPNASIPLPLSFSTASSTFFYKPQTKIISKDGVEMLEVHNIIELRKKPKRPFNSYQRKVKVTGNIDLDRKF